MIKEEYEKKLEHFLELRLQADVNSINHKMEMNLVSYDKQHIVLSFPVNSWQLNPMGNMHGGMIATAIDITMGCASYAFTQADNVPTVSMNIQYLKPVIANQDLFIKATVDHAGSRISQIRCVGWQQDEERICVSASGAYIVNK